MALIIHPHLALRLRTSRAIYKSSPPWCLLWHVMGCPNSSITCSNTSHSGTQVSYFILLTVPAALIRHVIANTVKWVGIVYNTHCRNVRRCFFVLCYNKFSILSGLVSSLWSRSFKNRTINSRHQSFLPHLKTSLALN